MGDSHPIRVGTSGFSAEGWVGSFYPAKTRPRDYLRRYSEQLDTVEIDSTFYRPPAESTVRNWYRQTPSGFVFAAKVPQAITHEKCMEQCERDVGEFVRAMAGLQEKLGPLLLQFPYYRKKSGMTLDDFSGRLGRFLPTLPRDWKFSVEVRNKDWAGPQLAEVLRKHGAALAFVDHPYMPRPLEMLAGDMMTSSFAYCRLLGDRYEIEEITKSWGQTVVDRSREVDEWIEVNKTLQKRVPVYTFVNNHFGGHAPATVRELKIRLGLEVKSAPQFALGF